MDLVTLIALIQGIPYIGPFSVYLPVVVLFAAALAVVVPAPSADAGALYKLAYGVLQWCALNKGHATNLTAPSSAGVVGGPQAAKVSS